MLFGAEGSVGRIARLARRRTLATRPGWNGLGARVTTVLGGQWGDEGKGKLVDILAGNYNIVARFNGGSNAGHTLVVNGKKYAFHLLPCGMLYPDKLNVIGNGVVLHIPTLLKELDQLNTDWQGRLMISDRSHILFDFHQVVDGLQESGRGSDGEIGTTKRGIGPCYGSKIHRNGIRFGEIFEDWDSFQKRYVDLLASFQRSYDFNYDANEELERFKSYRETLSGTVGDTIWYVNNALKSGKTLIAEGANAALLDIDFGTYPYVTSSSTTGGGICTGLGIAPNMIDSAIGVVKAYTTRVGGGPFPTELEDEVGQELRDVGHEYGTTTGRPRRCGWLDIPVARYGAQLNGYSSLNITKLDVLSGLSEIKVGVAYTVDGRRLKPSQMPNTLNGLGKVQVEYESMPGWKSDISQCRSFEDLPIEAQAYIQRIEELVEIPVSWIGVGAGREDMAKKGF